MFGKPFFISFSAFILINIALYLFIFFFYNLFPFHAFNYSNNADHYTLDPRVNHQRFDFLQALGQYDAQWYMKIADSGYPNREQIANIHTPKIIGGLTYAFFPLYPLLLFSLNFFVHN